MCTFKVSKKPNFLIYYSNFAPLKLLGGGEIKKFASRIFCPPLDLFLYTPLFTKLTCAYLLKENMEYLSELTAFYLVNNNIFHIIDHIKV